VVIYSTIIATALASFLILSAAGRVQQYMGQTGIRILTRMMGLLLVALAVQFVANGLIDFGLLKPLTNPF
jgi:multiple antibiotic resistance protein